MTNIRPVSDLRNNFAEISKLVHESSVPVFLTKNGYGDMVVMSVETFDNITRDYEIYQKLMAAEKEAERTEKWYTSEETLCAMRDAMRGDADV